MKKVTWFHTGQPHFEILMTTVVKLRVVAGRSRTRAGRPQAVSRRPMLIHTCHAVLCRGLEKSLWERHGRIMAWIWHGMRESNTAALCNRRDIVSKCLSIGVPGPETRQGCDIVSSPIRPESHWVSHTFFSTTPTNSLRLTHTLLALATTPTKSLGLIYTLLTTTPRKSLDHPHPCHHHAQKVVGSPTPFSPQLLEQVQPTPCLSVRSENHWVSATSFSQHWERLLFFACPYLQVTHTSPLKRGIFVSPKSPNGPSWFVT